MLEFSEHDGSSFDSTHPSRGDGVQSKKRGKANKPKEYAYTKGNHESLIMLWNYHTTKDNE